MIPAKFSELNIGDEFIHNHKHFIKIISQQIEIISCCNFPTKTIVNAKIDEKMVYFSPDEDIIFLENKKCR